MSAAAEPARPAVVSAAPLTLTSRLQAQSDQCALHGSPLTAALLSGAARDLAAGGVVAELLGRHAHEPAGSVPSLRLAGALHRLVLERRAPALALHYPSVGGTAPVLELWPAARDAIEEHLEALRELVARPVQTNEVGRSAALYGGLLHISGAAGLPVRLLEVGASAGLNLRVDRFAYRIAGQVLGDPGSPVLLEEPWRGRHPVGELQVVDRAGCDPAPLDPLTTDGRLTLTSYVWGDQLARLERLRGALQVAADVPAGLERASASAFLRRELAEPRLGVATVVWHSVVRQYMTPTERAKVDVLLAASGARATRTAPLYRLSMEPERTDGDSYAFRLELTSWPGGQVEVLADCQGHGPPVRWR